MPGGIRKGQSRPSLGEQFDRRRHVILFLFGQGTPPVLEGVDCPHLPHATSLSIREEG
jgi:hypothetical protein